MWHRSEAMGRSGHPSFPTLRRAVRGEVSRASFGDRDVATDFAPAHDPPGYDPQCSGYVRATQDLIRITAVKRKQTFPSFNARPQHGSRHFEFAYRLA
ncbi:hypothetical protein CI1B_72970 [Bradyrhizobium ivorense]|uniref:Uncharacterized protein n=1 Tax=Bradyrhizobium ivorense TaxID=2511166 RepID=A0A508TVK5_9BRAD|nr:hypothetical protein CI1B_72970 [Bradyrhizobium ivorense]